MITHDEVKIAVRKLHITALEDNEIVKDPIDDDLALTLNYITQQEKKDNLLELYKEKSRFVFMPDCNYKDINIKSLDIKIETLEEELK
jgi:hypothetical protein